MRCSEAKHYPPRLVGNRVVIRFSPSRHVECLHLSEATLLDVSLSPYWPSGASFSVSRYACRYRKYRGLRDLASRILITWCEHLQLFFQAWWRQTTVSNIMWLIYCVWGISWSMVWMDRVYNNCKSFWLKKVLSAVSFGGAFGGWICNEDMFVLMTDLVSSRKWNIFVQTKWKGPFGDSVRYSEKVRLIWGPLSHTWSAGWSIFVRFWLEQVERLWNVAYSAAICASVLSMDLGLFIYPWP